VSRTIPGAYPDIVGSLGGFCDIVDGGVFGGIGGVEDVGEGVFGNIGGVMEGVEEMEAGEGSEGVWDMGGIGVFCGRGGIEGVGGVGDDIVDGYYGEL
jgi:hypothetical protein